MENSVGGFFYYGVSDNNNLTIGGVNITQDQLLYTGYKYTFELRNHWAPQNHPRYPKHFVIAGRTTPIDTNLLLIVLNLISFVERYDEVYCIFLICISF